MSGVYCVGREAIVRGILNTPQYVVVLNFYEKGLARLEQRVEKQLTRRGERQPAQKMEQKLSRQVEKQPERKTEKLLAQRLDEQASEEERRRWNS